MPSGNYTKGVDNMSYMYPPQSMFNEIARHEYIKRFYLTPIHRIFNTRGIPGINRDDEKLLEGCGVKTPMDLVTELRNNTPINASTRCKTVYMVDFFTRNKLQGRNIYIAAVSIVCIEVSAPKDGRLSL